MMNNSWIDTLRKATQGELHTDLISRQVYSVDASIYEIEPAAIFLPKREEDLLIALKIAHENSIPVIPRGAATGTTGGCLGKGLIVDLSKYFNKIREIDLDKRSVILEPGVTQDQLNAALTPLGYRLGPDTSTGNRATIGGMLANNAAGAHSLKYGRMIDHVKEVKLMLSDGTSISLGEISQSDWALKAKLEGAEGRIYRALQSIIEENNEEIIARYPIIPRHVSGYSLDELIKPWPINLAKLIAGSEGTLGCITQIIMSIVPSPGHTGLAIIHFNDLYGALDWTTKILEFKPLALEVIDKHVIDLGRISTSMRGKLNWLKGEPGALLLVEFEGKSENEIDQILKEFCEWSSKYQVGYFRDYYLNTHDKENIWALRKAGVGLIMSRRTYSRAIAFVEDLAVSPADISSFMKEFCNCLEKHEMAAGVYGHAGAGCLHVRPFVDLRHPKELTAMQDVLEEMTRIILKYKGSLSGEHGDGLVRSWLNEKLFGPAIYSAFKKVKYAFDPPGLMNPGKIIADQGLKDNLRLSPTSITHEVSTLLDFSKEGGFAFAVDMCNGNGQCRKRDGLMCPTFQAYGDERHSTRARAQSLRALIHGKVPQEAFFSRELYDVLELCIECKGCKTECPSQVDMAKMKSEFLYHYQQVHGLPLRSRLFSLLPTLNRIGCFFAPISNRMGRFSLFKKLLEWTGITPHRTLPEFTVKRFSAWNKNRKISEGPHGEIILFVDTYIEFNTPAIGIAAVHVLESFGFKVQAPFIGCCGRPLISKGRLNQAKKAAEKMTSLFENNPEAPIIVLEPSCLSAFRDDYKDLLREDSFGKRCYSLEEFLLKEVDHEAFRSHFLSITQMIAIHTHCHQKALRGSKETVDLLKRLPGREIVEIQSGCCGLAGSFGYEKEHYDFSMKIGEDRLFPAVRSLKEDVCIVANGMSCRSQILHGTNRRPLHIAELLASSLKV